MQFLPIIERELRAAARQPRTWWRRMATMGVALAVLIFVFLTNRQWAGTVQIGTNVFNMMVACGFILALLSGPLSTVDCISRERRDGTLGLLFLTNLRAYDVVLGKIAAASLDMLLAFTGALPILAISFMLGGVALNQFSQVALVLLNTMFLSLALAVCFSSFVADARAALGLTILVLLFLTLGLPLLGEGVFKVRVHTWQSTLVYMSCPLYSIVGAARGINGFRTAEYWICLGATHGLAWVCLAIACWRTAVCWKVSEAICGSQWIDRLTRTRGGARGFSRRARALERNPIRWLDGRDRVQPVLLRVLFLITTAFWLYKHFKAPQSWPDSDVVLLWPLFSHYVLCLWIAIQSPRRLADDKQSGALELLLCTPLAPGEIISGCMGVLRRWFGRVLVALMALGLFGYYEYLVARNALRTPTKDVSELMLCGLVVFPIQAYAFARLGLYQGLAQGNSLRATFKLVAKVGLLPWGLFIASLLSLDSLRHYFRFLPQITDEIAFSSWAASHVVTCVVFLVHGNLRLRRHFRLLASESVKRVWWPLRLWGWPKGV